MNNFKDHQKLVSETANKLKKKGFEIEGKEVPLGIVINKKTIRADLLVSKDDGYSYSKVGD